MLMETDPKVLRSISSALSPEAWAEMEQRALEISAGLACRQPKRFAEIVEGVEPQWHVATVLPGQERSAATDLSERRFGVYLPESEHTEIRRGRPVDFKRLMLPGYVFVFVWDVDRHMDRIRACDSVRGLLFVSGHVAVVPQRLVDRIRAAENYERPLQGLVAQKRQRKSRKGRPVVDEATFTRDEIICVHSRSYAMDELRGDDEAVRLRAFHQAMGLAA